MTAAKSVRAAAAPGEAELAAASELHRRGRLDEAERGYRAALAHDPKLVDAWNNLGVLHRTRSDFAAAVAAYEAGLAIAPDRAGLHSNLGNALKDMDRFDEAIVAHERALALVPGDAGFLHNCGVAWKARGDLARAGEYFARACAIREGFVEAEWDLALVQLQRGDFARGWRGYEWRWKLPQVRPHGAKGPQWAGENLAGRTILLVGEQGFGDAIQFVRYAAMVKARGAGKAIVQCRPGLERLLATAPGVDATIAQSAPTPPYDVHCPLLGLPLAFATDAASIPAEIPYLRAPPNPTIAARIDGVAARLKIGVVWSGSPTHRNDRNRSVAPETFRRLAAVDGAHLFALAKGADPPAIAALGPADRVTDLGPLLGDFADTAAAVERLDLIVMVDSAVAHLAGALGKPVWVALPRVADWRWLETGETTAWYPSMRLFRQARHGDWGEVFERIAAAAAEFVPRRATPLPADALRRFTEGMAHQRAGRHEAAIAAYARAIAAAPEFADAMNNAGVALRALGRHAEAGAIYRRAVALRPDNAELRFNLGNAERAAGRLDEAIAEYRRALSLDPRSAKVMSQLGQALREAGRVKEALGCHREAARLDPASAAAMNDLGAALLDDRREEAALACFRRAVALDPGHLVARCNEGVALCQLGRFDEAMAAQREVLAREPDRADARASFAQCLIGLGRFADADREIDAALAADPNNVDALLGRARSLLLQGDLVRGFDAYEARWRRKGNPKPRLKAPEWDGGPAAGRTVLIYTEQGLGDTIQFVRYLPMLAESGWRVVLRCQPALADLMAGLDGVAAVAPHGKPLPAHDVQAPLLGLPRLYGTTRDTIPARVPYLRPPPGPPFALPQAMRRALKVGIVWAGNPDHANDRFRSLDPRLVLELARVPGIDLYSLQMGSAAEDLRRLGVDPLAFDLGPHLTGFADTARALSELDLLVSVDTAAAHLAGALGREVWMLTPAAPDWRWFGDGEATPWYPTMRLMRQERLGEWRPVVERVADMLARRAAEARR